MVKGKLFDEMGQICAYFVQHAKEQPLFEPEAKAASLINGIIESIHGLGKEDIAQMVHIINETERSGHYDGSGWIDYKMHLNALLRMNGFDITWNKDSTWAL